MSAGPIIRPFMSLIAALAGSLAVTLNADAIINGDAVKPFDIIARHTVAVGMPSDPCSGSLIANNLVLTAAHCVHGEPMEIVFGVAMKEEGAISLPVAAAEAHPNWNGEASAMGFYDLAILRFKGKLPPGYAPVQLITQDLQLNQGSPVILAGYGAFNIKTRSGKGVLRKTVAPILDWHLSPTEMSINQRNGTGACFGDSGGPAFVTAPGGRELLLIGLAHGGPACDDYGIYTKIDGHLNWIIQASQRIQDIQ